MRRTGISLAAPFRHGQKARRRLKLCRRKAQKHLTCTPSGSNGKQQGCSLRPKQVVLVSRLVLIALQFGANWRPKQLVLVEWKFPPVCSGGPTTFREAEKRLITPPFQQPFRPLAHLPESCSDVAFCLHFIHNSAVLLSNYHLNANSRNKKHIITASLRHFAITLQPNNYNVTGHSHCEPSKRKNLCVE